MNRTSEHDISIAVLGIADSRPDGVVTFKRAYSEIPTLINLSAGDLAVSDKRPNEAMWQQLVRNIKSHHTSEENFINLGYLVSVPHVGYRITDAGKAYLQSKGL